MYKYKVLIFFVTLNFCAGYLIAEDVFCDYCQMEMTQISSCDWLCENTQCYSRLTYETPPSSDDDHEDDGAGYASYKQTLLTFMLLVRCNFYWGKYNGRMPR